MNKSDIVEVLLVGMVAVLVGMMVGFVMNDIKGIRRALERANAYNEATQSLANCYYNHGYCLMEWNGEEYEILWREDSYKEV